MATSHARQPQQPGLCKLRHACLPLGGTATEKTESHDRRMSKSSSIGRSADDSDSTTIIFYEFNGGIGGAEYSTGKSSYGSSLEHRANLWMVGVRMQTSVEWATQQDALNVFAVAKTQNLTLR